MSEWDLEGFSQKWGEAPRVCLVSSLYLKHSNNNILSMFRGWNIFEKYSFPNFAPFFLNILVWIAIIWSQIKSILMVACRIWHLSGDLPPLLPALHLPGQQLQHSLCEEFLPSNITIPGSCELILTSYMLSTVGGMCIIFGYSTKFIILRKFVTQFFSSLVLLVVYFRGKQFSILGEALTPTDLQLKDPARLACTMCMQLQCS